MGDGRGARGFLAELDPLSFVERKRVCRERAQVLAEEGRLAEMLGALGELGRFGRETALAMAVAGRDDAYIVRALRSDEPDLAAWAVRVAVRHSEFDDALVSLMADASQALRAVVYQAVRRARRSAVADRLVGLVGAAYGPSEVALVLPACSAGVITEWLPQLPHKVALLRAVARHAPEVALDAAEHELAGLSRSLRRVWWSRHAEAVATAARTHPLRVLDLLERFTEPGSELPWSLDGSVSALVVADARRTVGLFIRSGAGHADLSPGLAHRLVRADPPNLTDFGRLVRDDSAELALLLRATPPHRREAFFDAAHADVDLGEWSIARDVLELLPAARRIAEARRMAARAERAGDSAARHTLLAHLPYDEVRDELLAQARRPDPAMRAEGYRALIACAARTRDPERFAAALRDDLERLRKEQDPVRNAAFHALAVVPPWLFTAEALGALTTLSSDPFAAPDLSSGTRGWLHTIAARILNEHARNDEQGLVAWALATLCVPSGLNTLWLPRAYLYGHEARVIEVLWPALRAAADRRDYRAVLSLARQLGRAAWDIDALQDVLGEVVRHGDSYDVERATELWLADPRHRDARVAVVVAADPSTITFDCVQNAVAWRRTDLLDPFLTGATPAGRYTADVQDPEDEDEDEDYEDDDDGPEEWAPWIGAAAARWVPRQREAYARLLTGLIADDDFPSDERADWLRALALVPEAGRPAVLRHIDSDDGLLRAAALGGLARVEEHSASLSLLLARANTDDAHAAVYAASRVARHVAPSRLGPELGAVAAARAMKVTARKEAVRLLVARGVPDGVERVADTVAGADVHPDVLRAALGAVVSRLDRPGAWQLAVRGVTAPRDVALALLSTHPLDVAESHRARFAALIAALCAHPDAETRRAAYRQFPAWAGWAPDHVAQLHTAVRDLAVRDSWKDAANAVHALFADGFGHETYNETIDALASAEDTEGADRDRPAAQRLAHLVESARLWARTNPRIAGTAVRALATRLIDRHHLTHMGVLLLAEAVPLSHAPADAVTAGLRDLARRCADRPVLAFQAGQRLTTRAQEMTPHQLLDTARALTTDATTQAGFLAVALAGAVGAKSGWPPEWRSLVRTLRTHPDPDVRDAARAVATATE